VEQSIETKRATRTNFLLALATGIAFGCSFPPFHLGALACVALVPLLLLIERLDRFSNQFRFTYFSFFIGSLIALYWVGGFTHAKDPFLMMAGSLLLVAEPVFFCLLIATYIFLRRKFGLKIGLFLLPIVWITFEWLYAVGEFSFPWLTFGNTQTYNLAKIQFAEITGVYGISMWIVIMNVLCFVLLLQQVHPEWKTSLSNNLYTAGAIILVYFAPNFYSLTISPIPLQNDHGHLLTLGIIQPNIDPWEKWTGDNTLLYRWKQVEGYFDQTRALERDSVQIAVWPETAILFNLPSFSQEYWKFKTAIDSMNIAVLSGYIDIHYYDKGEAPTGSSVIPGTNVHYDSYNSILFVQPHRDGFQHYAKMRLVPFAERIPYASDVPFLIEPLRWGVGISNWAIGKDSTIFSYDSTGTKFLAMVCYESIFPEYVSSYVKRGAEFIIFITNDSWWGNTSGARQHNQYAVLRAVENRRWVVRCANGGISSFIDPYGRMYDKTEMYTKASIVHTIQPLKNLTFYSRHGDFLARIAAVITGISFIAGIVIRNTEKQKT
jgi:apolipoprotein N-acyltransferase